MFQRPRNGHLDFAVMKQLFQAAAQRAFQRPRNGHLDLATQDTVPGEPANAFQRPRNGHLDCADYALKTLVAMLNGFNGHGTAISIAPTCCGVFQREKPSFQRPRNGHLDCAVLPRK